MTKIDKTTIIKDGAQIDKDVEIGPYSIIGPNVKIAKDVKIHSHVVISGNATINRNTEIFRSATIGTIPQDLKFSGETTEAIIGKNTTIREFVTVNLSTSVDNPTKVGNDCLLMAYVHIAHDCNLGDNVILANAVNLAGHVVIENNAIIGGLTPVHQFVHIGCFAFIGGLSRVSKDVAPYTRGASVPYKTSGLNSIGLRRNKFPAKVRKKLKQAYKIFYKSNLNTRQALEKIKNDMEMSKEIQHFVDFIASSKRGVAK